ncbi:MAG TPA: serine hydrolase [Polyangiales bacterium]
MRSWFLALPLLGLAIVGVRASRGHTPNDISAGTGYAAWELCTKTLQTGDSFEHVQRAYVEPKVYPLPLLWELTRGDDQVRVGTRIPGLGHARTALFRRGFGCTLIAPDTQLARVRAQSLHAVSEPPSNPQAWPAGEAAAEAQLASDTQRSVLARHAEIIFSEPNADLAHHQNATALLVASHGHLMYERYAQGFAREQPQLGWSMTKTLTAMIAGVMASDGKLTLDGAVGLPAWQGTPKAQITWRQLLNMAPGLAWEEGYRGAGDTTEMLFSRADQGGFAAAQPLTSKPGSVFTYSTGSSNIAMLRMRQLVGGQPQAIYDYYQSRLFAPLAIRHGVIEPDASGTPVGGARGLLRPLDWLRLGQLIANAGRWDGQSLIPADYVAFMTTPSPASDAYAGALWRRSAHMIGPRRQAQLPEELVWFAGHMGQLLIIVPSRQLLVLRMGASFDEDLTVEQTFALATDLLAVK